MMRELTDDELRRESERFRRRAANNIIYIGPEWRMQPRITDFVDNQTYFPEGWDTCPTSNP